MDTAEAFDRGCTDLPILITMQPADYVALDETMIDEGMLAEAHTLAGEFLRAAGL